MWLVTANTGTFTFTVLGETEAQARKLLARGWEQHVADTGATMPLEDVLDAANGFEIHVGDVRRDDTLIYTNIQEDLT